MNEHNPGFTTEIEWVGPLLRFRAWRAMRAYTKADREFQHFNWQMQSLEAERTELIQSHIVTKGSGEFDLEAFNAEFERITERMDILIKPWLRAGKRLEKPLRAAGGSWVMLGIENLTSRNSIGADELQGALLKSAADKARRRTRSP